jgi:hypothetical protein
VSIAAQPLGPEPVLMPRRAVTLHPHLVHMLWCSDVEARGELVDQIMAMSLEDGPAQVFDCCLTCDCDDAPAPGWQA